VDVLGFARSCVLDVTCVSRIAGNPPRRAGMTTTLDGYVAAALTVVAAVFALRAQLRFAVVEHAAAFIANLRALWAANAK
jgi:hypothetical protein